MRELKGIKKPAIALLITLFFIIAITVAIGIGLKQVNEANKHVQSDKLLLQTSMIFDDVLRFLQTSKEMKEIASDNTGDAFFFLLSQASFIPFESSGVKAIIELKSARSKFNINLIKDNNQSREALSIYLNNNSVDNIYVDMLLDVMGGIKEDESYLTEIFYDKPYLYRDHIVSKEHFNVIKEFYKKYYRENHIDKIDFDNLLYFIRKSNYKIDLNYATAEVWEMLLGCDKQRALQLSEGGGTYKKLADIDLQDDEKFILDKLSTIIGYYEPYIDVSVEVIYENQSAKINFEYDIAKGIGYNFGYEI